MYVVYMCLHAQIMWRRLAVDVDGLDSHLHARDHQRACKLAMRIVNFSVILEKPCAAADHADTYLGSLHT